MLAEWLLALLLLFYPGFQGQVDDVQVYVLSDQHHRMLVAETIPKYDTWQSHSRYTSAFSGDDQEFILVSEKAVAISKMMPKHIGRQWLASFVRVEVQYLVGLRSTDAEGIVEVADANTLLSPREAGLLAAINQERAQRHLAPLQVKPVLTEVARARSQDMTENEYFAHFHPRGISAFELLSAADVTFAAGGENLAKVGGDVGRSVQSAIDTLMRSPSHRDNILNPRYRYIGVGAVTSDSGITIFTMIFTGR